MGTSEAHELNDEQIQKIKTKLNSSMPGLARKFGLKPYLVVIQKCPDDYLARVISKDQIIIINSKYINDVREATCHLTHAMVNYKTRNNTHDTDQL